MQRFIEVFTNGTQIFVGHRPLVLGVAGVVHAVTHRLVLQVALTALIADRAVQWVVDEQKFHHAAAGVAHHLAVGMDDHAVGHRIAAGGDRFGRRLLDLDQTHAAIASNGQPFVVAEARNFDPGLLRSLQDSRAVGDLDRNAVDCDLRHYAFFR